MPDHFEPGDRVRNMDWDPSIEPGELGSVIADPAEADPDYVQVRFDSHETNWLVERASLEPERRWHKPEQLGNAVQAGEITRDEAILQLTAYTQGGLTVLGAADQIDNWRTCRQEYLEIVNDPDAFVVRDAPPWADVRRVELTRRVLRREADAFAKRITGLISGIEIRSSGPRTPRPANDLDEKIRDRLIRECGNGPEANAMEAGVFADAIRAALDALNEAEPYESDYVRAAIARKLNVDEQEG